ncbi:Furin-like protease 1, isoform 1 [Seminavis robusta]|uniref:subtilisin n=1 Tax=Seminavis robusta TaxID=568900 RepID=A0A9N8DFG9_9STRA|nr:Furin-like protease 1, isoform 1 [Seminavis robusta]|eukprot:Sro44_g026480.1 Furin-like protease 1, isoform 1 (834) ;mRNA; r:20477-23058
MTTLRLLLLGLLCVSTLSQEDDTNPFNYQCNILEVSGSGCSPQSWQLDNICEPTRQEGWCLDCLDCDPCRRFNFQCDDCVKAGCFWCPGDAICSSRIITQETWTRLQDESEVGSNLQPSCVSAEDWTTTPCSGISESSNATATTKDNIFSDPLFDSMEWLYNMINVQPVWEAGILGEGVRIRVNDVGGVDATHAEFDNRFDEEHSCEDYLPPAPGELPVESIREHGTAVASLALGGANNDQCAVGISPASILSACRMPKVGNPLLYATTLIIHLNFTDVSVNSWSLNACVAKQLVRRLQPDDNEKRNLQSTCPFSNEFSTSPCNVCGESLAAAGDNYAQLAPECRLSISSYCRTRFEYDVEACNDYLPLYAECFYDSILIPEERAALEIGVQQGRGGKGLIFVMSAGNERMNGDSTDGQKWVGTRYTISVGAVDKLGMHAPYSSMGAGLFITAPGGNSGHLANNIVAKVGGGCHDISAGTSFSAPVVAGVIALMLQVNSELTWRDVQGILASTSNKNDPDDDSWTTNAAGFHHSYKHGFGLIDAKKAVDAAETWNLWAPESYLTAESEPELNITIPPTDEAQSVETSLSVKAPPDSEFEVESVVAWLALDHPSRGDLNIVLTSPQGTESILHESLRPETTHLVDGTYWTLMTVRAWGESPDGDWTLSLRDDRPGNIRDTCVDIPFIFILLASPGAPNGAFVTCESIRRSASCADGQIVEPDIATLVNPISLLSPDVACCVCGGGMPPSQKSQLKDWKLVVYGRGATPAEEPEEEEESEDGSSSPGEESSTSDNGNSNENGADSSTSSSDSSIQALNKFWLHGIGLLCAFNFMR